MPDHAADIAGIYRRQDFQWNGAVAYRRTGPGSVAWLVRNACGFWAITSVLSLQAPEGCSGVAYTGSFDEELPEASMWVNVNSQMPVAEVRHILTHGSARSAGDPGCWRHAMSFELCCRASWGSNGLEMCWEGPFSFARCCRGTQHIPSDRWEHPAFSSPQVSGRKEQVASAKPRYARVPCVPPYCTFACLGPPPEFYTNAQDLGPWPEPLECKSGTGDGVSADVVRYHPIAYGIPAEEVVACVPEKVWDFALVRPGVIETYVFEPGVLSELEYKRMYRSSWFSLSPRKTGWDSMRHYEVLSSGSMMVIDLQECPNRTLAHMPKDLLRQVWSMPGVEGLRAAINRSGEAPRIQPHLFDPERYVALASELLRFTTHRLTTKALAAYVLRASGNEGARSALFVAECGYGTFLCYTMLHGFRQLLGSGFVDYPREEYMYRPARNRSLLQPFKSHTTCPHGYGSAHTGGGCWNVFQGQAFSFASGDRQVPLYGLGYSYAHRLEDGGSMGSLKTAAHRGIARRRFDVVIFGGAEHGNICAHSPTRLPARECQQLWEAAKKEYPAERLIVLDNADQLWGREEDRLRVRETARLAHYFVLNLPDDCP